jgi:diaminohydroxyphosphoribosylaminopyrimidine deaminase/5-amino-6-(5-phosphoribosylamino)uracil reductase
MLRALELAERGRGYVEPNPLVGAVVVRDGQSVGEGWHQRYGEAHAEVSALAAAGEAARGSTLYVTLEPCCHHGKTPPCTVAILRAGIGRVVAAMLDPFPQIAGKGAALLRDSGVAVEIGTAGKEARRLNAPYLKLLRTGRPYVHAKWAMSLDGKIATHTGDSKWISSKASRDRVHELRGRMDAILVGRGTAEADDPLLTARPAGARIPLRIVLTNHGNLRLDSQLIRTADAVPVLVVVQGQADEAQVAVLRNHHCEVLQLSERDDATNVLRLLDELGTRRMTNLLVEGGSAVLGSFLDAGAIDEVHVFVAARLIGGRDSLSPIGGLGIDRVAQAERLVEWQIEQIEQDLLVHGKVAPPQRD